MNIVEISSESSDLDFYKKKVNDLALKNNKFPKTRVISNIFKLKLWQLFDGLKVLNAFRIFNKSCKKCQRSYAEILISSFISQKNYCVKCKIFSIIFEKFLSVALKLVSKTLNIGKEGFRNILCENQSLRKLLTSYIRGIGLFGLRIPQIPAGPVITLWSITDRCNLNCTHCYIKKNTNINEINFEEACNIIDQLSRANNIIVGFSGGEPLLCRDIYDIIQYTKKSGMDVAIATNGLLINKRTALKLKSYGTDYIQISIDGLKETHDSIRGRGTFKKAIEAISCCLDVGLYVSMDVVITKLNYKEIFDLIDLAIHLGVQKFEILDFVPSENACNMSSIALTPYQIEQFGFVVCAIWKQLIDSNYPLTLSYKNPIFTRILSERYPNTQIMPFFKGIFPIDALKFFNFSNRLKKGIFKEQNSFSPFITGCEAGIYVLHIKPNGQVTPCPLNPCIIGNVRKHKIEDVWLYSKVLNKYRTHKFKNYCGKCIYRIICGGCRARVYLSRGNSAGADLSCYLNRKNCSIRFYTQ
ncbi:MAG: radical SAM protein [Candidatus Lokiarchaeota archaeon]|nr:radical SAM protein [Candidatus Lokiarchaeota archaeon]MBD3342034.1 radical SAM protein [Candidatus Lokiarchaeota archaeon]